MLTMHASAHHTYDVKAVMLSKLRNFYFSLTLTPNRRYLGEHAGCVQLMVRCRVENAPDSRSSWCRLFLISSISLSHRNYL